MTTLLKVFTYEYPIPYGRGMGVVVAATKEEAVDMIKEKPYHEFYEMDLEVTELNTTKPQLVDMSWVE